MLLCLAQILPFVLLSVFHLPKIIVTFYMNDYTVGTFCAAATLGSLGMQLIQNGIPLNFGIARGIGSFPYSVLTFFLGTLTVMFSTKCIPIVACGLIILVLLILKQFPEMGSQTSINTMQGGTLAVLRIIHTLRYL